MTNHNFHPDRWPVGNPETDFGNCDPGPSKEVIKLLGGHFYELCFGKRQPDELYDLRRDPQAVNNLAHDLAHREKMEALRYQMMQMLRDEQDPRAHGEAAIFDTYQYVGARNKGYETWLAAQEEKRVASEDVSRLIKNGVLVVAGAVLLLVANAIWWTEFWPPLIDRNGFTLLGILQVWPQTIVLLALNYTTANLNDTRDYAVATSHRREVGEIIECFEADWHREWVHRWIAHGGLYLNLSREWDAVGLRLRLAQAVLDAVAVDADGIHEHFALANLLLHILCGRPARRVVAVGDDHHRLLAVLAALRHRHRFSDGVIHRCAAIGMHAPDRGGEPVAIARCHLDIGEQVMTEGHRLRGLQMGEAGHHGVGVLQRPHRQRELIARQRGVNGVDGIAHEQPEVSRDLIVARAAITGVYGLARAFGDAYFQGVASPFRRNGRPGTPTFAEVGFECSGRLSSSPVRAFRLGRSSAPTSATT